MTMKSVEKAAFDMIEEVRRQFRTIDGIMEARLNPTMHSVWPFRPRPLSVR